MNDTVWLLPLDVVFRRRKDVAREGKFEHRQRVLLRIADDVVANFHASLVDDHEREDVNARRDFVGEFLPVPWRRGDHTVGWVRRCGGTAAHFHRGNATNRPRQGVINILRKPV